MDAKHFTQYGRSEACQALLDPAGTSCLPAAPPKCTNNFLASCPVPAFARPAFSPIRRRVASAHQNRISNSPTRQPSQPHRPETTLICVRPPTIGTHIQDEDLRRHILGPEDLPWKGTMNSSRAADGWMGAPGGCKRRNERAKSRVVVIGAQFVTATAVEEGTFRRKGKKTLDRGTKR